MELAPRFSQPVYVREFSTVKHIDKQFQSHGNLKENELRNNEENSGNDSVVSSSASNTDYSLDLFLVLFYCNLFCNVFICIHSVPLTKLV